MAGNEEEKYVVPAVVHLQPVFFEELGFWIQLVVNPGCVASGGNAGGDTSDRFPLICEFLFSP